MYSCDRQEQLSKTIRFLREMEFYSECQKTLVVDGKTNVVPHDFDVIQVSRSAGQFVWADMWHAGVATARFENILYLDSDRLLPTNYLKLVLDHVCDGRFVFTRQHFLMTGAEIEDDDCRFLLESDPKEARCSDIRFLNKLKYDPRHKEPFSGAGKNVMSGNTAFTKKTFLRLGGVDRWYRGHGAYADTDFHMQAGRAGCQFVDLGVNELHCWHPKLLGDQIVTKQKLDQMSLDNFIYYCNKWKLPTTLAENIAHNIGVKKPAAYVEEKVKEYAKGSSKKD